MAAQQQDKEHRLLTRQVFKQKKIVFGELPETLSCAELKPGKHHARKEFSKVQADSQKTRVSK
jgi:hypothetical protein